VEERARYAEVAAKAGHYESFYLKACRPDGGLGIWIRHTVHKLPGQEPTGSIWFTLFDREASGPSATKVTVPASELSVPPGGWIRVAGAEIGPGRAEGSVAGEELAATWSLRFGGDPEPCRYLPADWLYEAPLPRTKFVAPVPDAVFEGTLEVAGRSIQHLAEIFDGASSLAHLRIELTTQPQRRRIVRPRAHRMRQVPCGVGQLAATVVRRCAASERWPVVRIQIQRRLVVLQCEIELIG